MAGLLILVGLLAIIAGVWGLIQPIDRLGISDANRAARVLVAGVVMTFVGGAFTDTAPAEPASVAPIGEIPATTTTMTVTTTSSADTTTRPTTTTSPEPTVEVSGIVEDDTIGVVTADGRTETTTSTTSSTTTTTTSTTTTTVVVAGPTTTEACHPSYVGECVPIGVSDVDCRGGSGDGPYYVGRVQVVGWDEYGLDRDNDGIGCESS